MARTLIASKAVAADSATPVEMRAGATAADDANEMMFLNRAGRALLFVLCPATDSVDVSIVGVDDPYGRAETLGPTTVGNASFQIMGPFAPRLFSQQSGTDAFHTYVDIAAITGAPLLQVLEL